jgi:hypothetical protein
MNSVMHKVPFGRAEYMMCVILSLKYLRSNSLCRAEGTIVNSIYERGGM